jgi:hypothetical protein
LYLYKVDSGFVGGMLSGYEANQRLKARMKCMFDAEYGMPYGEGKILMRHMRCHAAGRSFKDGKLDGKLNRRCKARTLINHHRPANLFKQLTHRFRDWKVPKDPSG